MAMTKPNAAQIEFVPGGELAATVQSKLRETVSVKDFGAVGDGASNNLTAITRAIAAANGKTILVPVDDAGGDYAITSGTLTIPSTARFEYEAGARIYASGGSISDSGRHFHLFAGGPGEGKSDTLTRGFAIELKGGNSGTASSSTLQFNRIRIANDVLDAEPDKNGTKVDGLLVHHSFGGAGAKGGRHAVEAILDQTSLTEATNPDRNYVASVGLCQTSVGDGGTDSTMPSLSKGAYFGANFYGRLNSGATGVFNLTGCEFNSAAATGSSVYYRSGIQIAGGGDVRGDGVDAAVSISNLGNSTATWRNAIRIGAANGQHALGSDSKVLVAQASGTISSGFEIPKCTSNIIKSGDVYLTNTNLVLGAANSGIEIGSVTSPGAGYVDFHSSGKVVDYDSRIVATGGDTSTGNGVLTVHGTSIKLAARTEVATSGVVRPLPDNTDNLGSSDRRWATIYAGTGTINTSDEREKQGISAIDQAEKRVATRIKSMVKKFHFRDAVDKKGNDARIHMGVIAQEVIAAFAAEGLDATKYALLCYDEWDEQPEIKDKEGNIIQEYRPAGNRYGVRYEELLSFIIAAL